MPHYVAAASNPKAALALLRRVEGLIGVSVDVSELESAAADYERQVGLAVQSDPDIQAFVERLEQASDSEANGEPQDVPSGDLLAREFQRFLRQRGHEVAGRPRGRPRRPAVASASAAGHTIAVVAHRARRSARASGSNAWARIPSPTSSTDVLHRLGVVARCAGPAP